MQSRDAPAFQEYAASMMAKIEYRTLSLAERGLLYTMRLECWVNDRLPADSVRLAKVLGYSPGEVAGALPGLLAFFVEQDGFYSSPELDNYKLHLADSKKRMSDGGKKSASKRWPKHQ